MRETGQLDHSLAVEVRNSAGQIKSVRYVTKDVEFIPNRLYLYLLNRDFVKSDTWKIPFLLGKRIRRKQWESLTQPAP